ncbi:MAG: hypothetical protein WAZ14_00595 [Patescibacteria group bacterium]
MPSTLELSIYRTLGYFAYFKYPLTAFEVWKWLLQPEQSVSLAEVTEALSTSGWLQTKLNVFQSFYSLGTTEAWAQTRHERFLDAVRKYAKAEKIVQWLGRLPWIEGVAICNSLSWYQTTPDSDIDLFIITKPGRVWTGRLLSTLPAILFKQRPGELALDPVCLSFFCTETALAFETLKIDQSDPYLAYWCRSLVPLLDRRGWVEKFNVHNDWLTADLPHALPVQRANRFKTSVWWRWPWLPLSEHLARQLQLERFPASIRALMNVDSRVVVTDNMLKFHEQDARRLIAASLEEHMTKV